MLDYLKRKDVDAYKRVAAAIAEVTNTNKINIAELKKK
jgi:hypothetical protein